MPIKALAGRRFLLEARLTATRCGASPSTLVL